MEAISYTEARQNLAATMDKVVDGHDQVIITRQKAQAVVMMSLAGRKDVTNKPKVGMVQITAITIAATVAERLPSFCLVCLRVSELAVPSCTAPIGLATVALIVTPFVA